MACLTYVYITQLIKSFLWLIVILLYPSYETCRIIYMVLYSEENHTHVYFIKFTLYYITFMNSYRQGFSMTVLANCANVLCSSSSDFLLVGTTLVSHSFIPLVKSLTCASKTVMLNPCLYESYRFINVLIFFGNAQYNKKFI